MKSLLEYRTPEMESECLLSEIICASFDPANNTEEMEWEPEIKL